MKKRILALALAGTTAFSVFGGLNVFAKTPDEAYEGRGVNTISVETGKVSLSLSMVQKLF